MASRVRKYFKRLRERTQAKIQAEQNTKATSKETSFRRISGRQLTPEETMAAYTVAAAIFRESQFYSSGSTLATGALITAFPSISTLAFPSANSSQVRLQRSNAIRGRPLSGSGNSTRRYHEGRSLGTRSLNGSSRPSNSNGDTYRPPRFSFESTNSCDSNSSIACSSPAPNAAKTNKICSMTSPCCVASSSKPKTRRAPDYSPLTEAELVAFNLRRPLTWEQSHSRNVNELVQSPTRDDDAARYRTGRVKKLRVNLSPVPEVWQEQVLSEMGCELLERVPARSW